MEAIKTYLDNMFMSLPATREVIKAKEELLQMMEDKYHELKTSGKTENEAVGIVISEFGNLEDIAAELGLASYLGKDDGAAEEQPAEHQVNLEEARQYLADAGKYGSRIGLGVTLCVWSPIVLITFGGLFDDSFLENAASGLGLLVLLLLVAPAVAIFIYNGMKHEKYEYLQKERFQLDWQTESFIKEEQAEFRSVQGISITIGVVLCMLGATPLVVISTIFGDNDLWMGACVGVLLFLVGIATYLFVSTGTRSEAFNILLQKEEYDYSKKLRKEQKKTSEQVMSVVGGIYWPVVTCIFLAWSFIRSDWGISWIIWPVAGIIFGIISTIINTILGISKCDK